MTSRHARDQISASFPGQRSRFYSVSRSVLARKKTALSLNTNNTKRKHVTALTDNIHHIHTLSRATM